MAEEERKKAWQVVAQAGAQSDASLQVVEELRCSCSAGRRYRSGVPQRARQSPLVAVASAKGLRPEPSEILKH